MKKIKVRTHEVESLVSNALSTILTLRQDMKIVKVGNDLIPYVMYDGKTYDGYEVEGYLIKASPYALISTSSPDFDNWFRKTKMEHVKKLFTYFDERGIEIKISKKLYKAY